MSITIIIVAIIKHISKIQNISPRLFLELPCFESLRNCSTSNKMLGRIPWGLKMEIRQTRTHHQVRPEPVQQFGNYPVQFGPFVGSVIGLKICISDHHLESQLCSTHLAGSSTNSCSYFLLDGIGCIFKEPQTPRRKWNIPNSRQTGAEISVLNIFEHIWGISGSANILSTNPRNGSWKQISLEQLWSNAVDSIMQFQSWTNSFEPFLQVYPTERYCRAPVWVLIRHKDQCWIIYSWIAFSPQYRQLESSYILYLLQITPKRNNQSVSEAVFSLGFHC